MIKLPWGPETGCIVVFITYDDRLKEFVGKVSDVGVAVSAPNIPGVLAKLAQEMARIPLKGGPGSIIP